jgi:hypothetical protein
MNYEINFIEYNIQTAGFIRDIVFAIIDSKNSFTNKK